MIGAMRPCSGATLIAVVGLATALSGQSVVVNDWPQWQGPDRTGRSAESGLLKEWPAAGPPLAWSISTLGGGYGSVSIKDDRIFAQGSNGRQSVVYVMNRADGKGLWSKALGAAGNNDRGPGPLPEPRDYDLPAAPVTVDDAPALVPSGEEGPPQPAAESIPEDIESVAARRIRRPPPRPQPRWPVPGWTTAILLLVAINIGLIAFRADIVRLLPQTAAAYAAVGLDVNLRGLVFTELVTRKEAQDGTPMLVVEGVIKSTSKQAINVPRLRFAVRNAKGHEIYSWTALPARNTIAPGATIPFRSRLASPPPEAHAVLVRFFNRRDLIAGVQ